MFHKWAVLPRYWLVITPTVVIISLMVLLSGSSSAAPAVQPPANLVAEVTFEEQQPLCQTCHPDEYAAWKGTVHASATLDPAFHAALEKAGVDKNACLSCHTTGFDTGSGKFRSEGVTCEACHGAYKEGHPAAATMQLPMASETCRVCHSETFKEWEDSKHADKNIECFDCHLAHEQGLRTGSEETLCGACHSERLDQLKLATHGINGVSCASCHMAPESNQANGMEATARSHSFRVQGDVCAGCHQDTIHTSSVMASVREDPQQLQVLAQRAPVLEHEVSTLQDRVYDLRNVAVTGAGLAFGFGGFLGLIGGIVGMTVSQKRGKQ